MRLALTAGPVALVERLDQIDGSRAPLHPLFLQAWLRVFGPTDLAGRSFSALCGLAAVAVIYLLGRFAFDERTGRWAAWLAAVCPPLVYYSQEVRMYAWLVLLTCVSWLVFLSFRRSAKPAQCLIYWLLLTSLGLQSSPRSFHGRGARPVIPVGPFLSEVITGVLADDPGRGDRFDHAMARPVHGPSDGLSHATLFDPVFARRPD